MKPINIKSITFIISTLLVSKSILAQTCDGPDSTASIDGFTFPSDVDGKAYHTTSGLEWSRCVVGQTWNSSTNSCDGDGERLTWQAALQLSETYRLGNHTDWRVPNLKELVSLVQRSCVDPAIDIEVFPGTPSDNYWTSTPNTSADKADEAWSIGFYNGRIDSRDKQQDFYVRLVRYAE